MRSFLVCALTCALLQTSCGPADDGEGGEPEPSYPGTTLTHEGFDFSSGAVPAPEAVGDSDGDVVNWAPYPALNTDLSYLQHLWFRPELNDDVHNFIKDMGAIPLSEVTGPPEAWGCDPDRPLAPLTEGHVYVIKCADGHAKLKVLALRGADWEVDVDYLFTSGDSFEK